MDKRSETNNVTDMARAAHLFKLGIIASLIALAGDMVLGWAVPDESLTGLEQYFSRCQDRLVIGIGTYRNNG